MYEILSLYSSNWFMSSFIQVREIWAIESNLRLMRLWLKDFLWYTHLIIKSNMRKESRYSRVTLRGNYGAHIGVDKEIKKGYLKNILAARQDQDDKHMASKTRPIMWGSLLRDSS